MTAFRGLLVFGVSASLSVGSTQTAADRGSIILTGRVTEVTTGAPVSGAIVTLVASDTDGRGSSRRTESVMATADGAFVFRQLPAGNYTITAASFGYFRSDYPTQHIELTDGGKPKAIQIRMWKFAAISGRVVDERGEAVMGAHVHALQRRMIGGLVLRNDFPAAVTDDRGVYQFVNLPPGSYSVAVLASSTTIPVDLADSVSAAATGSNARFQLESMLRSGGAFQSGGDGVHMAGYVLQRRGPSPVVAADGRVLAYSNTFHPGTSDVTAATVVTLGSGESRSGLDISIQFLPTVRVSGALNVPAGPAQNVAVRLVPIATGELDSLEPVGCFSAITDANGRFMFFDVPAGQYSIHSSIITLATETSAGVSLTAHQPITVGEVETSGLEVSLKPGPAISGRVEFRAKPGTSTSAYERVTVSLRPIAATFWNVLPGIVNADGTFTAVGMAPGRYEIYSGSAGGWRVVGVTTAGRSVPDYVIDLGDRDISGVVVTLSNASRRLSGTVTDPAGAADPDALVVVFPADTTVWREGILQSRRAQRVRASSTGTYDIRSLASGDYYLTAVSSRYSLDWDDPLFLQRLVPGAARVSLADGDDKVLPLTTFTPKVR